MLLPHPQLRTSLLAAGLSIMALATNGAAAMESMQTVPGADSAVADTKILLNKQPAQTPFEKAAEPEKKEEAKAPIPAKSAIPEPAAAALGLIGLGLILFRRYRV